MSPPHADQPADASLLPQELDEAARAQQVSREALLLAIEAAEVGTWDLDLRTQVLTWPPRTKAMFGISPEVPCSMADFHAGLHPDDREATAAAFDSAIDPARRATYDVEYRTIGKEDGRVRWVAAKGRGVFDAQGRCVRALGTAIDITSHRAAASRQAFLLAFVDALRPLADPRAIMEAAVRLLRQYLGASRVGYAAIREDEKSVLLEIDAVEGVASLAGPYPLHTFGDGNIALLKQGRTATFEDASTVPENVQAHLERMQIRGQIAVPFLKDGRLRATLYVNQATPRIWLPEEVATVEDVASRTWDALERARAEQALREESRALETLNHTGALLAAELDLDKLVQRVIDACRELTGAQFGAFFYNVLDAAGESYMLYALSGVPRESFAGMPMPRATVLFGTTFRGEAVIRSADITQDPRYGHNAPHAGMPVGHLPVRSYLALPVVTRTGEVIGGMFFGHPGADVFTPRAERIAVGMASQAAIAIDNARLFQAAQRAQEGLQQRVQERTGELERAHEQLRQSQKMEAVGQLTGGIAHDFNNLLQGITGSLEVVRRRIAAGRTEDLQRFIDGAIQSARRAAALTHRLLAFSRRQPLAPKAVRANPLVQSMEELLRRTLGERIGLELQLQPELWPTRCDANQLESAILNLCINARDAMPDGGQLTIATRNTRIEAAEAAGREDLSPGEYICLRVADTGTGMSADVLAHAFDPFFTTKPIGQGTGLGLSMIYGFARQSEGHVRIDSEPAAGTTVSLYLPRHLGQAEHDEHPPAVEAQAPLQAGKTVLVIEDEEVVRSLIVEALRELGWRALEAADGPSGLAILQSAQAIDLLVTDVGLPGLNGRQVADAARLQRPELPVLFMTGYAENTVQSEGFLEPGMALLTKPFTMDDLAARLRAMVDGA
ncbi:GAF domain-containing protein [Xylophilus rhododendri]|uniref:histidine kinase n=1 Tax=Xylophilus rhododendri TaxID=2697032 RepID=A0A857JBR5_9BURK|nr:GAF domain-containing protein [Xylophilus rhododendri]QHJ00146.1 GAF domain-containing protein [Xylophilus rhododendri]